MRSILHSDLNNFYASVECVQNESLRNVPMVVVGDREERHGIVLAKNQIAKEFGIKTGDVIWQAKLKCGNLVEVVADMPKYLEYSRKVRAIYEQYTDRIEAFGIDECWLDVTESRLLFGNGEEIAEKIRKEIKEKLGLTVSIGVSFNKIFAKLGSEIKKPDAVTVITENNYREIVWKLPVGDLLYVGRATERKLRERGIRTIGDLAATDTNYLNKMLGKWGVYLSYFARGLDNSPVMRVDETDIVKSIGNSLTCYRDLNTYADVESLIYLLSDSVASRLREGGYGKAKLCHISYRDNLLVNFGKSKRFPYPTRLTSDIADIAFKAFLELSDLSRPVRSISVSVSDFTGKAEQLSMGITAENYDRKEKLEQTIDLVRKKYGNSIVKRAIVYRDSKLGNLDIKGDHVIHPIGFRLRNNEKNEN